MKIEDLQRSWEQFARIDPLWAILTDPAQSNRGWDKVEFFATGEAQVAFLMWKIESLGVELPREACLDFGCGVGRLTQALCSYFEKCYGIDIAPSMIATANEFNQHRDKCQYYLNETGDLRLFGDDSFDLVYSTLVLQHMRPEYSIGYIQEFLRIIRTGGMAVFQIPSALSTVLINGRLPESAFRARLSVDQLFGAISPGAQKTLLVRVQNVSDTVWPRLPDNNPYQIMLGNHWLDANGMLLVNDDGRVRLPRDLRPGEEIELSLTVTGPRKAGRYLLEFDLVQETVSWFKDNGSNTISIPIRNAYSGLADVYRKITSAFYVRPSTTAEQPPVMEMYCVQQGDIVEHVQQAGGKVVHILDDGYCGADGVSFTYFVTK